MLELTRDNLRQARGPLPMSLSYGGDTLNSAVYLARQGIAVDYVTALGDDPMSAWLVAKWRDEGVACDLVEFEPNGVPGMYLIETDDRGERSFYYWRDDTPAKRLLDDADRAKTIFAQLSGHAWLCLSGITLAIYSESARQHLFERLADYRRRGGRVAFDSNYRPKLWSSLQQTRQAYEAMYRLTDLALPTIEDEQAVFGDDDQFATIRRLRSLGLGEIALKMGEQGCLVVVDDQQELIPARKVDVVDTTSAGDSFNAGYLAARLSGKKAIAAAESGHRLASVVIQHKGAIIPRNAMSSN
ncbi:sugar kinase [Halieaceae bacterium IMCC8485]|uniref:Sugar kinase n=2 Tax=Candidatus Seongchinamella marina TaxID=2518990 RepID=A0ABT3T0E5_9GAMM|nr:sugar kinase [Candidatus Seongchinamella marina]